jgi:hypothetical protein
MVHSDSRLRERLHRWIAKTLVISILFQSIPFQVWASPTAPCAITGFRSGKNPQDEKIRKVLNDQLKTIKDIQIEDDFAVTVKLQEYTSSTVDPKSQAVIAAAYDHFNTGMQYYRKLDLTNSLKEFNAAVRGYREGISILRDNHYLLFSHLYLGIILHFLGRVEEGKKFIQEMVMLDFERKTRVLPQRDFPPKIVDLHKQVTKEVLARPVSVLSVDSTPSGAKVMFDGSEVGRTPYQLKDIPSGQHFLSLDLQGYQFYGAPIQINPGPQNFTTALKERNVFQTYAADAQTEAVKSELKTIAQKLDVDVLILGQTVPKDSTSVLVQAQMFDSRTSTFTDAIEETIQLKKLKFQSLVTKIKDGLTLSKPTAAKTVPTTVPVTKATTPAPSTTPSPKIKETKEVSSATSDSNLADFNDKAVKKNEVSGGSKPFYKKWWFWSIVGVAVIGGGGAYYLMQDRSATSNIITIDNPLIP